ncbi:hypothetical protein BN1013_00191 [Candidatus Rubidus massiliensis]|nr:MAG: hypothetical protein BGO10_07890 [Chlamydia sp. 32-24]CDZ79695.1 hypothetical protein BN1013_00191 [Candidatus Rubidus massiliensis]
MNINSHLITYCDNQLKFWKDVDPKKMPYLQIEDDSNLTVSSQEYIRTVKEKAIEYLGKQKEWIQLTENVKANKQNLYLNNDQLRTTCANQNRELEKKIEESSNNQKWKKVIAIACSITTIFAIALAIVSLPITLPFFIPFLTLAVASLAVGSAIITLTLAIIHRFKKESCVSKPSVINDQQFVTAISTAENSLISLESDIRRIGASLTYSEKKIKDLDKIIKSENGKQYTSNLKAHLTNLLDIFNPQRIKV